MRGLVRGRGVSRSIRPGFRGGKTFVPRPPFDIHMCESTFPRVQPVPDESDLQQALFKRNQQLSPTSQEQAAILNLMTDVCSVLDALIVNPGTFDACKIEEHRQVGSYKKGTMRTGHNVADVVVILKTLPTKQAVEALSARVLHDLQQHKSRDAALIRILDNDRGFEIVGDETNNNYGASVHILVSTVHQNMRKLSSGVHVEQRLLREHLAAVRHSRWFEENAHHSSIKVIIRLLHDLRLRFPGFCGLSPWILDLLAHYAVMNNPSRQALAVHVAYPRCFQLLASGLFLPGSSGITDPCESSNVRVHMSMSLKQQDMVCLTAQTLLRVLIHGGFKHVLGLENSEACADISSEVSEWHGVTVLPHCRVYDMDTTIDSTVTSDSMNDVKVEASAVIQPGKEE